MKPLIIVPLVIATTLAITGCSDRNKNSYQWQNPFDPNTPSNSTNPNNPNNLITTTSLSGQITDATTKQPIANATVKVGDKTATTDTQGHYSFTSVNAGATTITVTANGYTTFVMPQTLLTSANSLNFALTAVTTTVPATILAGQVTDVNTKQPIANATVKVGDKTATTDAQGKYSFTTVNAGVVIITVSAEGYTDNSLSPTLANTGNTVNVTLTPIDVTNPNPPTNPTNPISQTGTYRLDPAPTTMAAELTQINNLAAQGYALLGPTESGNLSYKPNGRNMQLEYTTVAGNTNSVATLNQMGQQGWMFKGPNMDNTMTAYDLYFRDKANPKIYQYQGLTTNAVVVTQANSLGANGWRFGGTFGANADPSTFFNLYIKDNSNTKYEYVADADGKSIASLRQQIISRAQDGWVYRGAIGADGNMMNPTIVQLFERPTANHPALTCEVIDVADGNTHLALMNDYAAKGYMWLGTQAVTNGTSTGTAMTVSYGDVYCKGVTNVWIGLVGPLLP